MRTLTLSVALLALGALAVPAVAQQPKTKADCATTGKAPEKIEGEVVKVDKDQGVVTVRTPDGKTQEFRGPKENVADYKVGDKIEAKLREQPC